MDRDFLKKILHEQMEPLDVAVKNKLHYLESDEVFTDVPTVAYKGSFSDSDIDTMFSDAFSTSIEKAPKPQPGNPPVRIGEGATTHVSRHQIIADKIAALRGISVDSDYLRKRRPGG